MKDMTPTESKNFYDKIVFFFGLLAIGFWLYDLAIIIHGVYYAFHDNLKYLLYIAGIPATLLGMLCWRTACKIDEDV